MIDQLGNLFFYLNDHLGSARVVLNAQTGQIADYHWYYAYGAPLGEQTSTGQAYKYTGQPFDDECGFDLYYYGARYYDPEIGMFRAVDPLFGKYPGWGPYVYVGGNPLSYSDPTGEYRVNLQKSREDYAAGGQRYEVPNYIPVWETRSQKILCAPYNIALSLGLLGADDSHQIALGVAGQTISALKDTKGAPRFLKGAGKALFLVGIALELREVFVGYTDPDAVINEYRKRHYRNGRHEVAYTEDEIHQRIWRIVRDLRSRGLLQDSESGESTNTSNTDGSIEQPADDTGGSPFETNGWGAEHANSPRD